MLQFKVLLTIVLCAVCLGSFSARADKPLPGTLDMVNPRALALGQTLRASPSGTSGVYLNPAVIAMVPIYHFELMYGYTAEDNMHSGGAAVVDSVTSMVGAGLSFNYSGIEDSHTKHDSYDGRLALAAGFGDVFFIGAGARYLHVEQNIRRTSRGPVGVAALPDSGSVQVDGFTFDAGAALYLARMLTIGVVGYNLTNPGSVFAPLQLAPGLSLSLLEMLLVEADVVIDFSSHDEVNAEIHAGVELFIAGQFALRGGYWYDPYYAQHAACAGLGYAHQKFAVDFGFMREVAEDGRMQFLFGLRYFVN